MRDYGLVKRVFMSEKVPALRMQIDQDMNILCYLFTRNL